MITLFVISLLTLLITTFKIKKKCGEWKDFDSVNAGYGLYIAFNVSAFLLLGYFLTFIFYLIKIGILP